MAGKEPSSSSPRVSTLRSAKRNSASAELLSTQNENSSSPSDGHSHHIEGPKQKRMKLSVTGRMQIKAGEESQIHENLKKKSKKKKPFKGFTMKKRVSKGRKSEPNLGDGDPVVDAMFVSSLDSQTNNTATNGASDRAVSNLFSENIEACREILTKHDMHTTTFQVREGPRKLRTSLSGLQLSTNVPSPRKSLFHVSNSAASPKKCLFQDSMIAMAQKKSSTHQCFDLSDRSHIQAVKAALHLSAVPDTLICRDVEQSKVYEFCQQHLVQQQPGSLYICGCPGTGKSLLMEKVKSLAFKWVEEVGLVAPEIFSFNCTSLTNPNDIFDRILGHVSPHQPKKGSKSCKDTGLRRLKSALCKSGNNSVKRMMLLIVDEIDYLLTKDQVILRELFELPAQESRCILIGISNSIDLADRCLHSFYSFSCRPVVIPFSPYTKEQLLAVLNQRLKALSFPVFQPAALELCARKVAAASGDMRKALHVCRIAFELLELERSLGADRTPATSGVRMPKAEASSSPSKKIGSPGKSKQEQRLVQIHHMAQALAKTFRSAAVDIVKSLPKHQQMVLCSAVLLFRQNKKDTTLGQLNVRYLDFCKTTGMPALSVPEFSSVCRVLADQGILNLGTSREERLKRVTLQVDQNDVVFALQAIKFFCNNLT